MARLISALSLVLLIVTSSLGEQSFVGTYRLVSITVEVDGKPFLQRGKAWHGYLVLTPTHFVVFYTADNRKFGASVEGKVALFDTLVATSGVYRVEGNKMITTYNASWVENVIGTTGEDTWQLSGNRLTLTYGPTPFPNDPSKMMINRRVWEKVE